MKNISILLIVAFFVFTGFKTGNPAYLLFDQKGKKVKYEKMMEALNEADVVLLANFIIILFRIGCNWRLQKIYMR